MKPPSPVYARKTTREDTPNHAIVEFFETLPGLTGPRFAITLVRPFADGHESATHTFRLTLSGFVLLRDAVNDAHYLHQTMEARSVARQPHAPNTHTNAMPKVPQAPDVADYPDGIGTKRRRLPLEFSDFANEVYQHVIGWHTAADYHRCTVPGICAKTVGRPDGRPRSKVRYALDTLEAARYLQRTTRILPDTSAAVWGPGSKRP